MRADVAQASEERVLESNIAREHQQGAARKHARRRLAHRKRAVCSKGKGGRTASHGRTGGRGMQTCKQAHDTENAASMANPALRSNKGVTPVVRPDKPYLSAVPPIQPISPPAQPMRCRPPARPRRFPPTEDACGAEKHPAAADFEPPRPPIWAMDTADASVLAMPLLCWSVRPAATYACRRPAPFAILGRFYIATADRTRTR